MHPLLFGGCPQIAGLIYDLSVGLGVNALTLLVVVFIRFSSKFWNRECVRFFGVQKRRRLNVYYGCASVGTGWVGARESQETSRFGELFQLRMPGVSDGDSLLNTIFLAAVKVHGIASCKDTEVTLEDSLITLGSPMYTLASDVFEKKIEPAISVRDEVIQFPGGKAEGDKLQAILVKKCRNGLAYFYAAGITEPGTVAASRYLAEHWRELARKYPEEQSFFVRLQLTGDHDQVRLLSEGRLE